MAAGTIPLIDPRVRHVGVSHLRELNASELKKQSQKKETLVIQVEDRPVAVIVSYDMYIAIQELIAGAQQKVTGAIAKAAAG